MLKKTITYTDYNGTERTEDHWFNINQAEALEMEMSHNGGLTVLLERIVQEKDSSKIIGFFKDFIHRSYGVKSDDGKRFIKSAQALEEFTQTEAYVQLYMELAFDAKAAAEFVNAVLPKPAAKKEAPVPASN